MALLLVILNTLAQISMSFGGEKKGNGLYKKSQTLVITRHQQSTAMVPVLFGTRDQFRRRQFFQGGVGEYSLGMIQA